MVEVVTPDAEQRGAFAPIARHAYAVDDADGTARWFDAVGHDRVRVVVADGQVVGGCVVLPMGQWFGGVPVPCLGIAGVAVGHGRVRHGHATSLMRGVLREARGQGLFLSALYASNHALYRASGYEHAGTAFEAKVPFPLAWSGDRSAPVRPMTVDDRPAVEAIALEVGRRSPGFLARSTYLWSRLWDPTRSGRPAWGQIVDGAAGPTGYLLYRKEPGTSSRHVVQVVDVGARDPATLRRLWGVLSDLSSMADELRFPTAPTDPLFLVHGDPRFEVTLFESWMLRVVDPAGALRARGYAADGRVDLCIEDPVFGVERVRLEVEGGVGQTSPGGDGSVRCDSRGLAAMYSGHLHPRLAAAMGRASGPDDQLGRFGAMLAGPAPWMRDRF